MNTVGRAVSTISPSNFSNVRRAVWVLFTKSSIWRKSSKCFNDDEPNVGVSAEKGIQFVVVIFCGMQNDDVVIGFHTALEEVFVSVLFRLFAIANRRL